MSPVEIVLIIGLVTLGATVQGSIGIGFALVAGPGLVAIDPAFAPGPMLLIGQIVGARHLMAEHQEIDRAALRNCLFGVPVGLLVGILVLESMDDRTLSILVGGATAVAALALLLGLSVKRSRTIEVGAGAATAFAGVTAGLPGPPIVAAFSDMRPATLRSTASAVIMTIAVVAFVSLSATGNFASEELRLLALLVPGAFLGLFVARYVRPHLERPAFRPLILVIAMLGGLALVARTL